jgi:hypothetical protein
VNRMPPWAISWAKFMRQAHQNGLPRDVLDDVTKAGEGVRRHGRARRRRKRPGARR